MQELLHALEHSLTETLKMLPFLIIAFAVLEIIEAKLEEKSSTAIQHAGKTGPALGALLGLIPQCGFSVIGSNFYAKRIISLGTLIAIYLSTSDEALLVMLTSGDQWVDLLLVIAFKFGIGITAGYVIDLVLRKAKQEPKECHHLHHHDDSCDDEELIGEDHCCSHTDWKAIAICTAKRTISVWIFLFVASVTWNWCIEAIVEVRLQKFMLTNSVFQPFLTALIGLIPNCAPSVILAEMYIGGTLSLGSVVAGLCTSAGVGLLVLFRVNRGIKSNILIVCLLYAISAFSGAVIQLIQGLM